MPISFSRLKAISLTSRFSPAGKFFIETSSSVGGSMNFDYKKLYNILARLKIKQCELAEKLSLSDTTISRWLSGNRTPNNEQISKIAEVLDISWAILYSYEKPLLLSIDLKDLITSLNQLNYGIWVGIYFKNSFTSFCHYILITEGVEDIFKRPKNDLIVDPEIWIESVHPHDRCRVITEKKSDCFPLSINYRIVHPSNEIIPVHEEIVNTVIDGKHLLIGTIRKLT